MSDYIDPETAIRSAAAGSMIYSRIWPSDSQAWELALFVREDADRVPKSSEPQIEIRSALIVESTVALIPIMCRVKDGHRSELYECWCNWHQDRGEALETLANQERITLAFYAPALARRLVITNQLRVFAAEASERIASMPAWSMRDFDSARDVVYARWPTASKLWRELAR